MSDFTTMIPLLLGAGVEPPTAEEQEWLRGTWSKYPELTFNSRLILARECLPLRRKANAAIARARYDGGQGSQN